MTVLTPLSARCAPSQGRGVFCDGSSSKGSAQGTKTALLIHRDRCGTVCMISDGKKSKVIHRGRRNASPTRDFFVFVIDGKITISVCFVRQRAYTAQTISAHPTKLPVGEAFRLPQEKRTIFNILPPVVLPKPPPPTPKNKKLSHGVCRKTAYPVGKVLGRGGVWGGDPFFPKKGSPPQGLLLQDLPLQGLISFNSTQNHPN